VPQAGKNVETLHPTETFHTYRRFYFRATKSFHAKDWSGPDGRSRGERARRRGGGGGPGRLRRPRPARPRRGAPGRGAHGGEAEEAALRRILIGRTADTYVLASIEKLGTVCAYKVTDLAEVAGIITDAPADHPAVREFRGRGVHVIEA
jgi:hypothetical protein